MGKLRIAVVAVVAGCVAGGCGDAPAARIDFSEPGSAACVEDEALWFADLGAVWITAEALDEERLAEGCVGADDASGWDSLESRLKSAGDLLVDLPVGDPFHLYLMGVRSRDDCEGQGPTTPFDFCAYTVDPVTIDRDADVRIDLDRYCQNNMTQSQCRTFAESHR